MKVVYVPWWGVDNFTMTLGAFGTKQEAWSVLEIALEGHEWSDKVGVGHYSNHLRGWMAPMVGGVVCFNYHRN